MVDGRLSPPTVNQLVLGASRLAKPADSRRAAAELLIETLEKRRTFDEAAATVKAFDALTGPDRGFAYAMASAAVRHLGIIDKGLNHFLDRPLSSASPEARALLRTGASQLWCLGTSQHAAVSETVDAAKAWPKARRAAGLINAVLRKASRDHSQFKDARNTEIWPDWLHRVFLDSLGREATERLAALQRRQAELHLTPKAGSAQDLADRLSGEATSTGQVTMQTSNTEMIEGYESGDWWVQDAAAALPARLMQFEPGDTVIDLCAAPGGKTMQLAAAGAQVTAIDRSAKRLKRVEANLERTGLAENVTILAADAGTWKPETPARHILLDAPCSALGTLRRHPEGAWIKRQNEVAKYPEAQSRLLKAAINMSASGGEILYCVCSPIRAEGVEVVETAIRTGLVERNPVGPEDAPGFEACITDQGDVLTVPPKDDARFDAFFISRLRVV